MQRDMTASVKSFETLGPGNRQADIIEKDASLCVLVWWWKWTATVSSLHTQQYLVAVIHTFKDTLGMYVRRLFMYFVGKLIEMLDEERKEEEEEQETKEEEKKG